MTVTYYAPDGREGGNKRRYYPSVCLSVHQSVAYIANNILIMYS